MSSVSLQTILHPFVLTSGKSKINKSTSKTGCNPNGINLKDMGINEYEEHFQQSIHKIIPWGSAGNTEQKHIIHAFPIQKNREEKMEIQLFKCMYLKKNTCNKKLGTVMNPCLLSSKEASYCQ